jgi:hypothetical protein
LDTSDVLFYTLRGYVLTVLIETPVLIFGLSKRHTMRDRLFAGLWLTACSYPVVALVIPYFVNPFSNRFLYLLLAETFAPISECILFWLAFGDRAELGRRSMYRDLGVVVLANLCSFGFGELLYACHWL